MLGFFICMWTHEDYIVTSNIGTNRGYSGYIIKPKSNKQKWAFVVEFKQVKDHRKLQTECQYGMDQIKRQKYSTSKRTIL